MKKTYYLFVLLLLALIGACSPRSGNNTNNPNESSKKDSINWSDSARKLYGVLTYYYNNNIHDTMVMKVPEVLDFCREHELWNDFYDTWMLLGEEYNFSGESNKAVQIAQEIHDDATKRGNKYGLTAAEFIKALVYDCQLNRQEAARSFERALASYPDDAEAFLKNSIYVYYVNELKNLEEMGKMEKVLDEWKAYIEERRADTTIPRKQFDNWLYYYHHSCYYYYIKKKDINKAAQHVDSVVKHIDRNGWSKVTRNEVAGFRTRLAIERKNYAEALRLNNEQLPDAKDLDINAYSEVLSQRAIILSKLGNWKDAYNFLEQHYELVDSINQEESRQQLNELNKRFELDELRAQQEREKIQHEREKMENERRLMYLTFIIGAIVVIAIITFFLLRQRAARRLAAIKAEQDRIENELRIARDIQMSMVPSTFPNREGLDMYASMTPAREVGGDLYGYMLNGDKLYFCLGDVSGKGVPASLFMAQVTRLFQTLAKQGLQPAEICTRINDALTGEDNENYMFVTFFLGLIDLNSGHMSFCNAGHNPPVIGGTPSHGDFLQMESNAPFGLWPGLQYVGEEIDNIKGRPLFIYTDGLNEAENPHQQQFGDERLLSILRNTHFESSQQVIETLAKEVEHHRNGAEPNDDLTMMCIRVTDM
jgi:serine phosphatase RsbU (regulator of sigma subunit)/tetratricopeptide (TPR) repeat protein